MLTVRREGARVPLVLAHPTGGSVHPYRDLIARLDDTQPVYAIASRAYRTALDEHETLAAMARAYAAEVHAELSAAPCRLFGWSMGAIVAHAVAGELEQLGARVDLVGMVDPAHPYWAPELAPRDDPRFAIIAAIRHLSPSPPPTPTLLRELRGTDGLDAPQLVALCVQQSLLPAEVSVSELDAMLRLVRHHRAIVVSHHPLPCQAPIRMWTASERPAEAAYWAAKTRSGLETHALGGDHYSVMRAPLLDIIAADLLSR